MSYRAVQVSAPGVLELVERPDQHPGEGEVLVAVEACGICGADRSDIERPTTLPRVPGHEVVGRILRIGARVPGIWHEGQRVGVGRLGGPCLTCQTCRAGRLHLCPHQPITGATRDGGYAERMLARHTGLVAIPDTLTSVSAAPLLCAGIATFNALRKCGAGPGDTVAILGIGGLGHMAVQYARQMGYHVVALGRGQDMVRDATALGAHHTIDMHMPDPGQPLRQLGGAAAIISTISDSDAIAAILPGLAPEGRLVLLGTGPQALPVPPGALVGRERGIIGSLTGSAAETEKALRFSALSGALPVLQALPLEAAATAYARMCSGAAKFRMVLEMTPDAHP